ncbi:MAG: hypothetical protein M0D54_02515 [Hyphomonadaceae bacterium JAD_PAG50586_4]|nr:MAG: hypothetical protein M0D54_02515 [Hyphomonadaceae bacterium JAD_PAG50586_4]
MSSDKLRERLEFMRVGAETRRALGGAKGAIEKGLSIGLDQFYDQISTRAFSQPFLLRRAAHRRGQIRPGAPLDAHRQR